MDYRSALEEQRNCVWLRSAQEIPDTLLLVRHPATITLGRASRRGQVTASSSQLAAAGIEVVEADRGGMVTYHGPGQLVGYPILDLIQPPHAPDLHVYIRKLEEVVIRAVAELGVTATRFPPHTGVWVISAEGPQKIAAIGVKVRSWVTSHGFALNVCPDMSHFGLIVPCGITEFGVTSLQAVLGRPVALEAAIAPLLRSFVEVFGYESLVEFR